MRVDQSDLYFLSGTLQLLHRQDHLPRAELCCQGRHPGETQRAEEEGGQGGGDGRDQLSPAGSLQHEETGKNCTLTTNYLLKQTLKYHPYNVIFQVGQPYI